MLNARQSDEMQRWRLKAEGRKASSQGSRSEYEVRELKLRVTGYLSKVPFWKPVRDDKNERGRKWRTSKRQRAKEKEKKGGGGDRTRSQTAMNQVQDE